MGIMETTFLVGDVVLKHDNTYMRCDSAVMNKVYNQVFAYGNVIIQQSDSLNVFSDSLRYEGNERKAYLLGNVVLSNKGNQLFTDKLNYDLYSKVASYLNGGMLANASSQLLSDKGYYYVRDKEAFFRGNVKVLDDRFTLKADTLKFNTESQVSTFLGPTDIFMDSIHIYTEKGYYDAQRNVAEFTQSPRLNKAGQTAYADRMYYDGKTKTTRLEGHANYIDGDKIANADVIRYDEANKKTYLEGNANYREGDARTINADKIIHDGLTGAYTTEGRTHFQSKEQSVRADQSFYNEKNKETVLIGNVFISDNKQQITADSVRYSDSNGDGVANGNVHWRDTSSRTDIYCAQANYNKQRDFLKAIGRPLLVALIDNDTLYLAADTLFAKRNSAQDSSRILIANKDVRVFKRDMQAVADSMTYNSHDSLFAFYKQPVIWSDTTQFIADTVRIKLHDKQIDRVLLFGNSLILNSLDEHFFNQVKGRDMEAIFKDNKIDRMDVRGNAEAVYYGLDTGNAYVAVNKTVCSDMNLHFANNQVQYIDFFGKPSSTLYPMKQVNHEEIKLKGFRWEKSKRPHSVNDLHTPYADMLQ